MKRLTSIETDEVQLEVIECNCGFHLGVDATFLDQEGDCVFDCPACYVKIDTAKVCPKEE